MGRLMLTFILLTGLACGGTPTEPSGEQHGPEGGGGNAYGVTGTHDEVPRRFAPTGDRFAAGTGDGFAPEQVIVLPPERVVVFTGRRNLPRRRALPGAGTRHVAAGGPDVLRAAAPRHPRAQPHRVLHRRVAIAHKALLLHRDQDFEIIAALRPLQERRLGL